MRIEDRIGAESAAQAGAATEPQKTRQPSASSAGGAMGFTDRLQLSSLAGRIRNGFEQIAQKHADRVASLAAEVRSGRYHADVGRLSRAMATEVLGEARL